MSREGGIHKRQFTQGHLFWELKPSLTLPQTTTAKVDSSMIHLSSASRCLLASWESCPGTPRPLCWSSLDKGRQEEMAALVLLHNLSACLRRGKELTGKWIRWMEWKDKSSSARWDPVSLTVEAWFGGMASLSDGSGILHLPRLCKIACGAEGGGKQQLDCSAATSGISLACVKRALYMGHSSQHQHSLLATDRTSCPQLQIALLILSLVPPQLLISARLTWGLTCLIPQNFRSREKTEAYPVLHCHFIRGLSDKWSYGMVLEAMQ